MSERERKTHKKVRNGREEGERGESEWRRVREKMVIRCPSELYESVCIVHACEHEIHI